MIKFNHYKERLTFFTVPSEPFTNPVLVHIFLRNIILAPSNHCNANHCNGHVDNGYQDYPVFLLLYEQAL